MAAPLYKKPFDIPDVPGWVPRRLKPWLFIFFVVIVQFSGGVYLAAASDMVGTTALMQQDIMMAGYASLIGMSLNFCVMFRIKFRFSNRTQLLTAGAVLLAANFICAATDSLPVLIVTCLIAGWFRMQATFACNSTIQLWLTPTRDMSVFFCYVFLVVDGVIQCTGIAAIYAADALQWQYYHWIITGALVVMMIAVIILVRPVRGPMYIPLLGIDWAGSLLWAVVFLCFTFVCVYGDYYDWWEAPVIRAATLMGLAAFALTLWRATFLRHPYVSLPVLTNRVILRALGVYTVFYTLLSTEHVVEHRYEESILGFDSTNAADLNWYVLVGIVFGAAFTYLTFARRKWRYKTLCAVAFGLLCVYLAYFYLYVDYGIEKEALFVPLFCRGFASVIINVVLLTSIVQCGLSFMVFPQGLVLNGFGAAIVGATFGPALLGEVLERLVARNATLLSARLTDAHLAAYTTGGQDALPGLIGMVQRQAFAVSVKELFGMLLIVAVISLLVIMVSYMPVRPRAIQPTWATLRRFAYAAVRTALSPLRP